MDRKSLLFFIATLAVIAAAVVLARWVDRPSAPGTQAGESARVFPAAERTGPVICLVLDDFGYTTRNLQALKGIGAPVTLAVLPNLPYTRKVCAFARDNGMEVILHLPVEPENEEAGLEKNTLCCGMDEAEVRSIIEDDLRSVIYARGVSNHMGSRGTRDTRLMRTVMDELNKKDLFFLDSLTTRNSVCRQAAVEKGVPFASRDIFIDNKIDADAIRGQLKSLEKIALAGGRALGIGHDRPLTIEVLRVAVPEMRRKGIRFVKLSDYVEGKRRQ